MLQEILEKWSLRILYNMASLWWVRLGMRIGIVCRVMRIRNEDYNSVTGNEDLLIMFSLVYHKGHSTVERRRNQTRQDRRTGQTKIWETCWISSHISSEITISGNHTYCYCINTNSWKIYYTSYIRWLIIIIFVNILYHDNAEILIASQPIR